MIKYCAGFAGLLIVFSCQSQQETVAPGPTSPNYHSLGITGSKEDVQTATSGGTVLMGGSTDVDEAIQWMIQKSGGGDFVVIRASGSTGYNNYIYELGEVNSVETLLINSKSAANKAEVGNRIREAEALFIAGGDQWDYVNYWKGTEVAAAINYLLTVKKVPVGGTSAGCAILSEIIFDARNGSVISDEALNNPYHSFVSLSSGFLSTPFLTDVVADQHYAQRNRQGRHVAFLARMKKDLGIEEPKGIGVDEKTAVCIDASGQATVFGSGHAYFLKANTLPEQCITGQPLEWIKNEDAIQVNIISGSAAGTSAFNLSAWPAEPDQFWWVDNGQLKTKNN
jgi:cyanophycinase